MPRFCYSIFILCILSASAFADEALFAMGCFWSGEVAFREETTNKPLKGIKSITVGYAGGLSPHPTYHHHPDYKEAVHIEFDPKVISYAQLLNVFWHNIDPFDENGQFCDQGLSYVAAIFTYTRQQMREAEISKDHLQQKFKHKIVTQIIPYSTFHKAEEYHQNYKHKNPLTYSFYRQSCERDIRLQEVWNAE